MRHCCRLLSRTGLWCSLLVAGCLAVMGPSALVPTVISQEINWASPTDGVWKDASSWAGGVVPTVGDTAVIDETGGPYSVTISNTTVDPAAIVLDSADVEVLMFQGTYAGTTTPAAIEIANGRLVMADASYLKNLTVTLSGGSLRIGENYYGSPDGVTRNYLENVTFDSGASRWAGNIVSTGLVQLLNGHTVFVGADATQTNSVNISGAGFSGNGAVMLVAEDGLSRGVTLNVRTIGSGITLQTHSAGGGISTDDFQNAGRLIAEGQNLRVLADSSLTNLAGGEMIARNGGVLILDSASPLVNEGLIATETGGYIVLSGNYRTSDLAHITRSGGGVALSGKLDNMGQTLLAEDVDYLGGTVNGGVISTATDQGVNVQQFWGSNNNVYNGVVLDTTAVVGLNETLYVGSDGLDLTGRGKLFVSQGKLSVHSGGVLTSTSGGGELWLSDGRIEDKSFEVDQTILLRAKAGWSSIATNATNDRYTGLINRGGIVVESGAQLSSGRMQNIAGVTVEEGGHFHARVIGDLGSLVLRGGSASLRSDSLWDAEARSYYDMPFNMNQAVIVGPGASLQLAAIPTFDSGVVIDVAGGELWSDVDYDWLRDTPSAIYSAGGSSVFNGDLASRSEGYLFDDGVLQTKIGAGAELVNTRLYSTTGSALLVGVGADQPYRDLYWSGSPAALDGVHVQGGMSVVDDGYATLQGDWQIDGPITVGRGSRLAISGDYNAAEFSALGISAEQGAVMLMNGTMATGAPQQILLGSEISQLHFGNYRLESTRLTSVGDDRAEVYVQAVGNASWFKDVTIGDGVDVTTLDFVYLRVEGDLTLEQGGTLRLQPVFNSKPSTLQFVGNSPQRINGDGVIYFDEALEDWWATSPERSRNNLYVGDQRVTIGSGIDMLIARRTMISSDFQTVAGELVLEGDLMADGGTEAPLVMQLDRFENHGTFELLDGTPGQWEVGQWVNAGRLTLDVAEAALVGDWTQEATGVLEVGLGGGRVGRGPSRLTVDGAMDLAGTLGLLYDEGFVAEAGDTFDILDFTTINGAFDAVDYDRSAGIAWDLSELYTTGQITAELLGDMDGDRSLDLNDVLGFVLALTDPEAYAATYGIDQNVRGDFSGDGGLSFNDINPFADALNLSASQRASLLSAVPEPSVAAMLGVCLVGVAGRRRAC